MPLNAAGRIFPSRGELPQCRRCSANENRQGQFHIEQMVMNVVGDVVSRTYLGEVVADLDAWLAVHRRDLDHHIQCLAFILSPG